MRAIAFAPKMLTSIIWKPLNEKSYDLGGVEVTPTSEEEVLETAFNTLKEMLETPKVIKSYYSASAVNINDGKKVYSAHLFGAYLYQELVNRRKKRFEWFQNGLTGFVGQHKYFGNAESLEEPSEFPNFSIRQGISRIISMENFGYLNDLLLIISDLKTKELIYDEENSSGPYDAYTYESKDTEIIIKIHYADQRIAEVNAKELPRPLQPNIFWSENKQVSLNFAWDEWGFFLSRIAWSDAKPNLQITSELFLLQENTNWKIDWNKGETSRFFDRTLSSYYANYERKVWENKGLNQYFEQYGKHLDLSQAAENDKVENMRQSDYWEQFNLYLNEIGIKWD